MPPPISTDKSALGLAFIADPATAHLTAIETRRMGLPECTEIYYVMNERKTHLIQTGYEIDGWRVPQALAANDLRILLMIYVEKT